MLHRAGSSRRAKTSLLRYDLAFQFTLDKTI